MLMAEVAQSRPVQCEVDFGKPNLSDFEFE